MVKQMIYSKMKNYQIYYHKMTSMMNNYNKIMKYSVKQI